MNVFLPAGHLSKAQKAGHEGSTNICEVEEEPPQTPLLSTADTKAHNTHTKRSKTQ